MEGTIISNSRGRMRMGRITLQTIVLLIFGSVALHLHSLIIRIKNLSDYTLKVGTLYGYICILDGYYTRILVILVV
jgi:hypothetical protein